MLFQIYDLEVEWTVMNVEFRNSLVAKNMGHNSVNIAEAAIRNLHFL